MEASPVIDVTDQDFTELVEEGSRERPVVVDFWADWCAPCRILGPVLEKLAVEKGGDFLLARLDVDSNPEMAGRFGVMSIPAVKAFVDGAVVDGFTGAVSESDVRRWIEAILPSGADLLAREAAARAASGDARGAETGFLEALASDPSNLAAGLGFAGLLVERGERGRAEEILRPLAPNTEAERMLASIGVQEWGELDDTTALNRAKRLAAAGEWRAALDRMLAIIHEDPGAKEAILEVFAMLGPDDQMVGEYRPKLAAALF